MRGFADILRKLAGGRTYDDATEPLTDALSVATLYRYLPAARAVITHGEPAE